MSRIVSAGMQAGVPTLPQPPSNIAIRAKVTTFTPAHWRQAVATLVSAFADDPVAAHIFPDPTKRPAGMAHIFQMGLRYGQKYGRVDVIEPAGAVAVWIRPECTTPSWSRMVQAGLLATPFNVGWGATRRMLRFEHFIEACRIRTLGVPHWYLFCIGVSPDHQSQGLGAAMIRHGLEYIRPTGFPCYLETANARNLQFYQKNGFWLVGEQHHPDAGPGVWRMVSKSSQ